MADRRMIHRKVIESDAFYGLPESAQALYMHLTIGADDDGFCNNAESAAVRLKGGKNALQKLVEKRFLLQFGEVYVIKHWRIGNSLKNDRNKPLSYPGIAGRLWVKDNRAYTDHPVDGCRTLLEIKTGIRLESDRNPGGIHSESVWNPNRTEPNRTEPNRTEPNRTEPNQQEGVDAVFQRLWNAYPEGKRGAKRSAMAAVDSCITEGVDWEFLFRSLELWKQSEQWAKESGRFIPLLSNWLERGYYLTLPQETAVKEPDEDEIQAIRRMMEMDV